MNKLISVFILLISATLSFAQTPIFNETFDQNDGIGGNDGKWSRISTHQDAVFDNSGWSGTLNNIYKASKCVRVGRPSVTGSHTLSSPPIGIRGRGLLTFRAGAWNTQSENRYIKLSIQGARITSLLSEYEGGGNIEMTRGAWTTYLVAFETLDDAEEITIRFETVANTNNRFFLDDVQVYKTPFPITISSLGYATFFNSLPCQLPDGVTAYTVVNNDDQTNVKIVALDRKTFPTNTPLLLKGEAGEHNVELVVDGGEKVTNNLLKGQSQSGVVTPTGQNQIYVLNTGANGVGFYWQTEGGVSAQVGAGRCYLEYNLPASQGAQGLSLDESIVSSVPFVQETKSDSEVYDLAGRRVQQMGRGLYIVNGKKLIR